MHRHIYCKKVKDSIKCCAGNAEQSGISVGEKGSPDTKPYLNNCKQNNQNGGCDIREAQIFPEWVKGKEHKWKEVKKCKYAYFDDADIQVALYDTSLYEAVGSKMMNRRLLRPWLCAC